MLKKLNLLLLASVILFLVGCEDVYDGQLHVEKAFQVTDIHSRHVDIPVGYHDLEMRVHGGRNLEFRVKDAISHGDLTFVLSGFESEINSRVSSRSGDRSYEFNFWGDDNVTRENWWIRGTARMYWSSEEKLEFKDCQPNHLDQPNPYHFRGHRRIIHKINYQAKSVLATIHEPAGENLATLNVWYRRDFDSSRTSGPCEVWW